MAELALEGVSKEFAGHVTGVADLDLTIRDREFVVLVGPSGCGKTTTLRLIAGLDVPNEGTIRFDGRPVNGVAPKERNIAMMFQHSVLYPHLTVYKNLAFGLAMRGGGSWWRGVWTRWRYPADARPTAYRPGDVANAVLNAARILGIEHLLDRMPRQLSGGERQRVALGRAIVRRPAAFLLDEPLSNLDAQLRVEMRRELKRLHRQWQTTMVLVTHDQEEALSLGERIVVMNQGRCVQVGTPSEVYERPKDVFVAEFLGSPAMNLIRGRREGSGSEQRFVRGNLTVPLSARADASRFRADGGECILGIRPADIRCVPRPRSRAAAGRPQNATALSSTASGRVVLTELLGESTLVTVALDAGEETERQGQDRVPLEVSALVPARHAEDTGTEVAIQIEATRVFLFDARTGENLDGSRPRV